jgi:heterodisulfide reductase subunit B
MQKRDEYMEEFHKVKPQVLERDGNCCVKCKSILSLEVHHVDGYKNNDPQFLVTLCYLCHAVAPMGERVIRAVDAAG